MAQSYDYEFVTESYTKISLINQSATDYLLEIDPTQWLTAVWEKNEHLPPRFGNTTTKYFGIHKFYVTRIS